MCVISRTLSSEGNASLNDSKRHENVNTHQITHQKRKRIDSKRHENAKTHDSRFSQCNTHTRDDEHTDNSDDNTHLTMFLFSALVRYPVRPLSFLPNACVRFWCVSAFTSQPIAIRINRRWLH